MQKTQTRIREKKNTNLKGTKIDKVSKIIKPKENIELMWITFDYFLTKKSQRFEDEIRKK